MSINEWQQKRDYLEKQLAIEADATQKYKLIKEIEECNKKIQELEARQSNPNTRRSNDKSRNNNFFKIIWSSGAAILILLIVVNIFGEHNPQPVIKPSPSTTSSAPSQGTKSEPQTTSKQNSETGLKQWCLNMKQQAKLGDAKDINYVKKQMESQNCSSLGVSLP